MKSPQPLSANKAMQHESAPGAETGVKPPVNIPPAMLAASLRSQGELLQLVAQFHFRRPMPALEPLYSTVRAQLLETAKLNAEIADELDAIAADGSKTEVQP